MTSMRSAFRPLGYIIITLAAATVLYAMLNFAMNDQQSRDDRAELRQALAEEKAIVDALAEQVEGLGGKPIVRPDEAVPPELRYVPIPGRDGEDGADGVTVPGRDGQDGAAGSPGVDAPPPVNGRDGTTGPAGPAGPAGPKGEPGASGKDGAAGRSITDAQCGDDGRWTLTYSDGTSNDAGSCRAGLLD